MTKIRITKQRDGFQVQSGPLVICYLNFFEGLAYRLTGHVPDWAVRAAEWTQAPDPGAKPHFNVRQEP